LATGLNDKGESVSTNKLMTLIGTRVDSDKLEPIDKLRLVLIATITMEMVEKDRKALSDNLDVEHQRAILNLRWLGINP
jgi:hypothetical protein